MARLPKFNTLSAQEIDKTFLDCSTVYAGSFTTTITGLSRLNGATVSILADGVVISNQVVSGGVITLTTPAEVVHVGLAYESVLQPMRIDTDNQIGGSQGLVKRIHQIVFRFLDTQGPYSLSTTPGGTAVSIQLKTAVPLATFNGDAPPWDYSADYDPDATFVVRQAKPLPLTLLGAFVKYQITES